MPEEKPPLEKMAQDPWGIMARNLSLAQWRQLRTLNSTIQKKIETKA